MHCAIQKKDIYYCIVLSSSQLDFLAGSKYGIDRMKVLKCLIDTAAIKETRYEKKGFAATLHIGQAALSEVELATRLGYDKKTVSRLLDKMTELGIWELSHPNRPIARAYTLCIVYRRGMQTIKRYSIRIM